MKIRPIEKVRFNIFNRRQSSPFLYRGIKAIKKDISGHETFSEVMTRVRKLLGNLKDI